MRSRVCFTEDDFGESFPPKQKPKGMRGYGCRGPDPRELALGAFRKMFCFSVVRKEDGCGSVQKGEGECGSETVTGQRGLVVGFLDGTGA